MKSLSSRLILLSQIIIIVIFFSTCEKPEHVVKISTLDSADSLYSYTWAIVRGEVTDIGTNIIEDHGILLSENTIPISSNSFYQPLGSRRTKGIFRYKYTGLKKNTTYYYRAVAYSNSEPVYGATKSLKTKDTDKPSVTTTAASDINLTSARSGGTITTDGGETITKKGLCIAKNPGVDILNALDTTVNLAAGNSWEEALTGLEQGTTYYVKAYAINTKGTGYGNEISFITALPAEATTSIATDTTGTSVILNGSVNPKNLSSSVSFEWGPTIAYGNEANSVPQIISGSDPVNVSASITGLTPGTTYHYRLKCENSAGTFFGNDLTFKTLLLPVVATTIPTGITGTSGVLNGTIDPKGYLASVSFEYGTSTSYGSTINANPASASGTSVVSVNAPLSGLTEGTTYHYRIKAVNKAGIAYGSDFTLTPVSAPSSVTDFDGNTYNTVLIGTQLWLKENLRSVSYSNGELIGTTSSLNLDISQEVWPRYQWTYNGSEGMAANYGRLYTWYAATDTRNLCPVGWHVPTDMEYTELTDYLTNNGFGYGGSGNDIAASLSDKTSWDYSATPGTPGNDQASNNSSGFSGMAGGYRSASGSFVQVGTFGWWTTSTENDFSSGHSMGINNGSPGILDTYYSKRSGSSIRCVMGPLSLAEASYPVSVSSTGATLAGKINPNGATAIVSFEFGQTQSYGSSFTPSQSPVSGISPADISFNVGSLQPGTTYHFRIKAVNSGGTAYSNDVTFTTDLIDADGISYKTVTIGSQVWMKENLRTTKLNDNSSIPVITDNVTWIAQGSPAMCYFNNDPSTYANTYGAFYNWFTVYTGKLCPAGWHVPDDTEFNNLLNALGGNMVAGGHLKEAGYVHWSSPNTGADNSSGFTALPAGHRANNGAFINFGTNTYWWTTVPYPDGLQADRFNVDYNSAGASQSQYERTAGFSVRCVKD
ncbi:MAG: FISUMP domain-containing protein [Bacteroidales bacterium]